ncbi:type ISP restriction/modification enzyme [Helicobacter sp. MIT 14-3879]|uniref:type ISP restriction/modification enzyme n=1 Tax=Helicobacter sp. MIT 14-3879 TaxID=2040649 RepID=UPI000E1E3EA7|nr:type ISP restriction/modification enzyme [Helicobacter sp. MIT 14-3879]RDU65568.1 hypothetical protein CQA44_00895 [Helicobacter sp. MIT 14-3879]
MLDSTIGEPLYKDTKNKNLRIEKIMYNAESKELFVNDSLYFCGVEKAVWEYKIGGYQVLDKYLKSHKTEEIDFEHFSNIIKTLSKSQIIEHNISQIELK